MCISRRPPRRLKKYLRQKSGFLRQFCSTAIFSCYNKINQKEGGGYLENRSALHCRCAIRIFRRFRTIGECSCCGTLHRTGFRVRNSGKVQVITSSMKIKSPNDSKERNTKMKKLNCFLKAVSKKYRRLLSIMLAIAAAMVVPVTSQADSFNGNKSIDGFSVDYSVTASTHKSNAYLSCEGTTYQNPKPLFITGSVTVRMRGSNDILYISFIEQDSVEYGERLYLTTSVTAPGEVSFTAGISIFSFLGVRWNVQYKR